MGGKRKVSVRRGHELANALHFKRCGCTLYITLVSNDFPNPENLSFPRLKRLNHGGPFVNNYATKPLDQSFPRLGSLRGCERAHVLVMRMCKRACMPAARTCTEHIEKSPPT